MTLSKTWHQSESFWWYSWGLPVQGPIIIRQVSCCNTRGPSARNGRHESGFLLIENWGAFISRSRSFKDRFTAQQAKHWNVPLRLHFHRQSICPQESSKHPAGCLIECNGGKQLVFGTLKSEWGSVEVQFYPSIPADVDRDERDSMGPRNWANRTSCVIHGQFPRGKKTLELRAHFSRRRWSLDYSRTRSRFYLGRKG